MIRALRSVCTALFVMSLFCLASCNRCCDCFPSPCAVQCPPVCDTCPRPCLPKCDPCPNYGPCNDQFRFQPVATACSTEANPFFPCDPSYFPCGGSGGEGGGCGPNGCEPPFPGERCYSNMRSYQTCDDCVVDLYQIAPEFATVGSPYPVEIYISARKECAAVKVHQTLPCGSEFVKSDPPAVPDRSGSLHWEFPHMTQGETQRICVWMKPMKEGCCLAAATICACPQLCAYTNCGQPVVCIKKCGPECVCLYCPVQYVIDVCNSGSATAYDVVVQDTFPEGLTHSSGMNCLTYQLGDLKCGESRQIVVDLCATKRGCVTNTATVSYCGGPKCVAEATTLVNMPCVEVTKTGPDWAYICKPVDYTITITNPGDLVLRDVVVDDVSPAGTTIVAAPGAEICCNRAIWVIPQICPGETKVLCVSVRSQVCGCLTNKVTVTTHSDCGECVSCAEACTCWKGLPATHMCIVDTCDPICLGETTIYRICVTNRGSCDDNCVGFVMQFSEELEPLSANGPTAARISGQTVIFDDMPVLAPQQSVEYCVTVRGVAPGDARAEATLTSEGLGSPVIAVEGTHVY